ncbi:hypothetical protein Tco_1468029 [Tanacetum coccineum]
MKNKPKVRTSRNKLVVSKASTTSSSTPAYLPEITALTDAIKAMLLQNKTPSPAPVKAIEEIYVTCGRPHPYYECLAIDGNTFNASAATGTYNQGGQGYRPQGETIIVLDTIRINLNQGNQNYQALLNQTQVGPSNDFSNYMKTNDVNVRVMQNQINNIKAEFKNEVQTTMRNQSNELKNDIKNMMSSFFQMNSPLGSRLLPSNTVANPRGDLKAITTRSGVSYDGPTIPTTFSPLPRKWNINQDKFVRNPDPISYDETPDFSYPPPQPQYETYSCELCGNDSHYGFDYPPRLPLTAELSRRFNSIYDDDDDDEETTIPLNEIISQLPPSIAITTILPAMEPEDSLIMRDENLSTILEKELEEFIKSSIEDLVPIPRRNFVTFSNPLCDANDDFTSSDDESLPKEDALLVTHLSELNKDECFDPRGDEIEACITSDSIPPKIDDVDFDPEGDILLLEKLLSDDTSFSLPPKELYFEDLKMIKSSIDTPPDFKDDCYDSKGDTIYLESLVFKDTIPNLLPEVFLDHDPRSLKDEPDNNDLKSMVKVFDPEIHEKIISPTYVRIAPDYEDSRARGFVHRSLKLQSLACLYMGIRYPRSY